MRQVLLLCVLLFGFQLAAVEQSSPKWEPFSLLSAPAFIDELKAVAGRDGIDCGTSSTRAPQDSLAVCGQKAFQDRKSFFLAYLEIGERSLASGYGLSADKEGGVFVFNYRFFPPFPAVISRRSRIADNSHTQIVECVKPITFGKTAEGMLACIIPVNEQESAKAGNQTPVETSVCAVLDNPAAWNNKLVHIRGHYSGNFEYSTLGSDSCDESLWFEYAGGDGPPNLAAYVGGGARPGSEDADGKLILPVRITLVRDSKFEQFEKQVKAMSKADNDFHKRSPNKFVNHCVTSTFTGRVDVVSLGIREFHKAHPNNRNDFSGFGQMGSYDGEFVLQKVDADSVMQACKD